jgi:transposase-like protein
MKRRKFSKEFKIEACKLVLNQHQSVASTSRDLGIGDGLLTKWVRAYHADSGALSLEKERLRLFNNDEGLKKNLKGNDGARHSKKGNSVLRGKPKVKYAFIKNNRLSFSLRLLCSILRVSHGYLSCVVSSPS